MAIHEARSLDVIELDAASNRGIDTIREIRERAVARAERRRPQDLHPRRGPLAHGRRLERAPEDARGAAGARRVRALHDRAAQAARRRSARAASASRSGGRGPGEIPPCCAASPTPSRSRSTTRARRLIARAAGGSFRDAVGSSTSSRRVRAARSSADEAPGAARARRGGALGRRRPDRRGRRGRRAARHRRAGRGRPGPRPGRAGLLGQLRLLSCCSTRASCRPRAEPPPDRLADCAGRRVALPPVVTLRT